MYRHRERILKKKKSVDTLFDFNLTFFWLGISLHKIAHFRVKSIKNWFIYKLKCFKIKMGRYVSHLDIFHISNWIKLPIILYIFYTGASIVHLTKFKNWRHREFRPFGLTYPPNVKSSLKESLAITLFPRSCRVQKPQKKKWHNYQMT